MFFFNYFFSLNVQSIFASLLLIIYTSSTIFTFSLIKFSNRKNRRCKHFITFAIFTEIFWRVFRGWRLLNIVTKSYLSYMWQYFWICLTQELHKEWKRQKLYVSLCQYSHEIYKFLTPTKFFSFNISLQAREQIDQLKIFNAALSIIFKYKNIIKMSLDLIVFIQEIIYLK